MKILIVDDELIMIKYFRKIFDDMNYDYIIAERGEDALQLIKTNQFNLIILDIELPDINGIEILKNIRKKWNQLALPIIIISAITDETKIKEFVKLGANDYISKPFNRIELEIKVKTLSNLYKINENQRQNELLIQKQNEELKELNNTKDKFFSIIAHDLKNHFNGLIGLSDVLIFHFHLLENKEKMDLIKSINNTSKKTFQLLNNLLDWARSQSGRIEYNIKKYNISEIIGSVMNQYSHIAQKKGIKIVGEFDPDIFAYFDKNTTETAIRNLLSNAIKYTKKEGKVVFGINDETERIVIYISDNGVGISKDKVEKLFHIENNISTKGTENEQGTGLGLILCKELVSKNGGEIWVKSKEGRGSTFYFSLPKIKNKKTN